MLPYAPDSQIIRSLLLLDEQFSMWSNTTDSPGYALIRIGAFDVPFSTTRLGLCCVLAAKYTRLRSTGYVPPLNQIVEPAGILELFAMSHHHGRGDASVPALVIAPVGLT
jgi:hypothetical protein